jgi:hypothetical protein
MHQLIRMTAKELAGAFYEQSMRSPMFRRAFPTVRDFLRGHAHRRDGSIEYQDPNWLQFVDLAKTMLVKQLVAKETSQHIKDAIEEALIENARRGSKPGAKTVLQTTLDQRDDQRMAYSPAIAG